MTQVVVGQSEPIESALRRFKRQVARVGIYTDYKKHQFFETPEEKRKRKEATRQRQRSRRN
ncbi:30S ribosomal protein S21 [Candidatus Atelocyanobacterium thalassae]|jgi:small subunit ribosomal protein S21|uniref:Small ribosomal subunit protein bS21 n=1 Tax=Atelocyanobacterium thalassa (isolate ALOHA) TaxID=1453429 RepID=D3EPQ6_ATETH|nr:30S ribosomal protein S21 [Candidatus Atelocyanobacterium thalassa]ADB95456.1 SSU ribosomal protein S21P [Candidatus Atelocyanobacterium thalassa isolate ALOHA]MCH2543595.1 30S ribosomal protein S21 [Candidatus Atelocyanobacterium sp. ALOHA_A2.5_9]|tara:strand:- start:226152 stop:226334 length:183 start_codon:yes stop_codon:yes gene_type:complete